MNLAVKLYAYFVFFQDQLRKVRKMVKREVYLPPGTTRIWDPAGVS